jgi:ABC-type branched-subunit amino acid transport system ATPase component
MTALLQIEDVSKRFGGYLALNNIRCAIAERQIHALIGPNGAGKTTLFNIISGFARPTGGRVAFAGKDYTGQRADQILAMGIARNFQQVRLFPGLSVVENVMIGCHSCIGGGLSGMLLVRRAERTARARALQMLSFVGMAGRGEVSPNDLTLVEQRRLEIARALAPEPRLLLLDEPAAGMNPSEVMELARLIRRIRDLGITVLLVEHHMRLVMKVADRITVLSAGRVIADDSPEEIRRDQAVIAAYLGSDG